MIAGIIIALVVLALVGVLGVTALPLKAAGLGVGFVLGRFLPDVWLNNKIKGRQKELRLALPNARVMIHQPSGGARGQVTDIEIQAKESRLMKDVITEILVNATGKSKEQISKDIDRDFYLGAAQAKEYGLIDDVLVPKRKGGPKEDR